MLESSTKAIKVHRKFVNDEDGDINNNDRTKHISINEGVSEDEHASDTGKSEDLTTGDRGKSRGSFASTLSIP